MISATKAHAIYLNGPSSVGKTTLARMLQEVLHPNYLHIGLDRIIGMMPLKTNDWEGRNLPKDGFYWLETCDMQGHKMLQLQQGHYAKQILNAYRSLSLNLLNDNFSVIIDDVSFGSDDVKKWQNILADHDVLWVGLSAPLETLEIRERDRKRPAGSSRDQFYRVHEDVKYDLTFNTAVNTPTEIANRIKEHLDG